MRDDRAFIEDMLARIAMVEEFVQPGREIFMTSIMTQEAVIRSLEIIGEASRSLSDEFRTAQAQVPWRQIAAFRNFVIHVYWEIKVERIWEIIENDLPSLKAQLQAILPILDTHESDDT